MNCKKIILILAVVLLNTVSAFCDDPIVSVKSYKDLNLTEIVLTNGLKIVLKPTEFENDEVLYRLVAAGGYGQLPQDKMQSGQLAAQVGWESGIGEYSSDQVSVLLYEHSLEFFPKIMPFYRVVEGSSTSKGVDSFLKCLNLFFTSPQFHKEGFKTVLAEVKNSLSKSSLDCESLYEAEYMAANTQCMPALQALKQKDLTKIDFETSKRFYHESFSNPADFTLVIVGCFDLESIQPIINRRLGSIPAKGKAKEFAQNSTFSFPKGITHKIVHIPSRNDSLTRITLPLTVSLNEKNISSFEYVCQVIEARLRKVITDQMNLSYGIDVAYEFPLYPAMSNPWISIQFRCDQKKIDALTHTILNEVKHLQKDGPSEDEVNQVKEYQSSSDEFWLNDNYYWVSILANFYMWKWNPELLKQQWEGTRQIERELVVEILKTYFDLSNYSIVTAKPKSK